jgi:hypothetical protein
MMGPWTCSCCISTAALIGRLLTRDCAPPWPASAGVTRRSTTCWWGEQGLPRWLSSWKPCHEACPGTSHRRLSGGGGRRVGAGANGSHRLWLRRRLLVPSAWAAPVPLGLSARPQELVGWSTEADDRILNHCRLPLERQVSTRSHRPQHVRPVVDSWAEDRAPDDLLFSASEGGYLHARTVGPWRDRRGATDGSMAWRDHTRNA